MSVVLVVSMLAFAGVASAHTSPEYFWDGWDGDGKVGHRHTLYEVSARNVSGNSQICIFALNDDGSTAGGVVACSGAYAGALVVQQYNGSSWRRGASAPQAYMNYRVREDF